METKQLSMRNFGLIGRNISYSFSQNYFSNKFKNENIDNAKYRNFDISSIEQFSTIISSTKNIKGLNVTIPYKEEIIPFLDELDETAKTIGAVNTIKVHKNNKLKGYNTDYYGFKNSLKPLLKPNHSKALILGTGGASKAIAFALEKLDISYQFVSRKTSENTLSYSDLDEDVIKNHTIIINCTPLGTFPDTEDKPNLPYNAITSAHILYDLIYNPEETAFLKEGKQKGAIICNGLKMLQLQAEKAWDIWNQ